MSLYITKIMTFFSAMLLLYGMFAVTTCDAGLPMTPQPPLNVLEEEENVFHEPLENLLPPPGPEFHPEDQGEEQEHARVGGGGSGPLAPMDPDDADDAEYPPIVQVDTVTANSIPLTTTPRISIADVP